MTAFQDLGRLYRSGRRMAGGARRYLFPRPEVAAWNKACSAAEKTFRFTSGRICLLDYDLEYVDLLTLCPQWNDLFVRETFKVQMGREDPRILDCGANIGLASLYFKRRYPQARITAFEADPAIAVTLRGNLQRNGCGDVEVVTAAVWTEEGLVDFCREGADSGTIDAFSTKLPGKREMVPSIRLKPLLERERIDLLKIDIEGGETAVLQDCADVLANVRVLLLDLHEFDGARRATARILDLLDRAGFVFSLDDLSPLPWREPVAKAESPFPGTHLCWSVLLRAFRA